MDGVGEFVQDRGGDASSARSLRSSRSSHLSGCEGGLEDPGVELVFVGAPGSGDWGAACDLGGEGGGEVSEVGVEDPGVGLGEEDGQSVSVAGQLIALGVRDPLDEPLRRSRLRS
jgi:hypothetical protein